MLRPYSSAASGSVLEDGVPIGPYYYFSLAVLGWPRSSCGASSARRLVSCLKTIRDNPLKAESLGVSVPALSLVRFMLSVRLRGVGGGAAGPRPPATWTRRSPTGRTRATSSSCCCSRLSSFFWPLLCAFAFIFLQDTVMSVFPYWRLIFGAVLAFIVIFAPGGLMGLFARRRRGEASRAV